MARSAALKVGASGAQRSLAAFFSFTGVIGAAATVLSVINEIHPLATWTQVALELWSLASTEFWRLAARLLGLSMEKWIASVLTFSAFMLFTSIGVRMGSAAPRLGLLGAVGRFLLLTAFALIFSGFVAALFIGPLGLAPGREQGATMLAMAAIYAPAVLLTVWLTRRNRGESAFYSWATIALSSSVALLFALSILATSNLPEDIRLLLFTLVFGVLSGFAIAAPLLLAPHTDLFRRFATIYAIVAMIFAMSEVSKM